MLLMPKTFTLGELQKVYEQVLGAPVDRHTFRRRIGELEIVEPILGNRVSEGGRPAQCYRLKQRFVRELATAGSNLGVKT